MAAPAAMPALQPVRPAVATTTRGTGGGATTSVRAAVAAQVLASGADVVAQTAAAEQTEAAAEPPSEVAATLTLTAPSPTAVAPAPVGPPEPVPPPRRAPTPQPVVQPPGGRAILADGPQRRGLRNADGVSCSQNAVVSALLASPSVRELAHSGQLGTPLRDAEQYLYAAGGGTRPVSLRELGVQTMPRGRQHDAAEYLRNLAAAHPQLHALTHSQAVCQQRCPLLGTTGQHIIEHEPQATTVGVVAVGLSTMQQHGNLLAVLRQRGSRNGVPTTCAACLEGEWGYQSRVLVRYRVLPRVLVVTANRRAEGVKHEDVPFGYPLTFEATALGPKAPADASHGAEVPGLPLERFRGTYNLVAQVVHKGTAVGGHVRAVHMHGRGLRVDDTNRYTLVDDHRVSVMSKSAMERATVGGPGATSTTQLWVYELGTSATHPRRMVGATTARTGRVQRRRRRPDRPGLVEFDGPMAREVVGGALTA